ncbi:MAG: hemerythrin domain-containing protein [Halothiobacillus sp.]
MRRHIQLQPFSRAHHQTLRLVRALKYGEQGWGDFRKSLGLAQALLMQHFAEEEAEFSILADRLPEDHELIGLLAQMVSEHIFIMAEVLGIIRSADDKGLSSYKTLGHMLAEHIAFEEQVLFPCLEQCCLPHDVAPMVIS